MGAWEGRGKKEQTLASDAQLLYYACLPLSHCFLERLKINTFVMPTCNSHFPDKLLTLKPQPLKEGFDASLFQQALSNSECSSTADLATSKLVEGLRRESGSPGPEHHQGLHYKFRLLWGAVQLTF